MFLFALFDSLAILPLTSHVRLETGCWEGMSALHCCCCFSWVNFRQKKNTVLYICPANTSLLHCLSAISSSSSIPQGCFKMPRSGMWWQQPPPPFLPGFLSHLSVHCECARMSFWKVCVCACLYVFGNCTIWCCTVGVVEHKQECMF